MDRRSFLYASTLPAAQRPEPKSEFDYVDWSWQRWREITGETRPRISSEQAGKAELVELAPRSKADWAKKRETIERVLAVFLGAPPASRVPLAPSIVSETPAEGYTRLRLVYQVGPGEGVPAYLLIPNGIRGRTAAVVCPHQTTQAGKDSPAGLADDPRLHMAVHLARRGYVTFTYDALCFGERHKLSSGHYGEAIPFYRQYPEWSLMGKMVWDLSRGIDYLETLDFVDPRRIGCIGHSHGGITTLFSMALDRRIAAGASNCGFDTFRIDGNVWRWSHATAVLPRLGFYAASPHLNMEFYRGMPDSEVVSTPFDLHQLLALIAPRPLLLSTSDEDFVFPNAGWSARRSLARLEPLYRLLASGDRLSSYFFSAGHSFPADASVRAYAWLDRWLGR